MKKRKNDVNEMANSTPPGVMELSDDELEAAAGGKWFKQPRFVRAVCPECGDVSSVNESDFERGVDCCNKCYYRHRRLVSLERL